MCHQPTGWASKQPHGDAGGSEPGDLKGAVKLSPPLKAGFSLPSSGETEAENDFHLPGPQSQREKSKALG